MTTAYSYIRFSTPAQAEGDSERRQMDAATLRRELEEIRKLLARDR